MSSQVSLLPKFIQQESVSSVTFSDGCFSLVYFISYNSLVPKFNLWLFSTCLSLLHDIHVYIVCCGSYFILLSPFVAVFYYNTAPPLTHLLLFIFTKHGTFALVSTKPISTFVPISQTQPLRTPCPSISQLDLHLISIYT